MKSTTQRRAALVALLLAPLTAACGFDVQTDQVYQPGVGVNERSGDVDVLNALIVSAEDGSGTFAGTLVNTTEDPISLASVTGPGLNVTAESIALAGDRATNLAEDGAVVVNGEGVVAGRFVELTLVFNSGQSTTVRVPVVENEGPYADVPVPAAG